MQASADAGAPVGYDLTRVEAWIARHVPDLVTDALQVRHRLDDREYQSQVPGGGLAAHQDALAFLVEVHLERVDIHIAAHHARGTLLVTACERGDPLVELRQHQLPHAQHAPVQVLEVLVVLLHRVLADFVLAHDHDPASPDQPKRPVM